MKTTNEMTLYDLMAEDLDIYIGVNSKFGHDLEIDDENGNTIVIEEGIHPYAIDSFADFCSRYLASYQRMKKRQAA